MLKLVVGKPTQNLSRSVAKVGTAYAEKLARKRSDLDDVVFEAVPADNGKFAVKIAGRPDEAESEPEAKSEAAAAEKQETPPAEETKPAGVSKLASMLGLVKKPKGEADEKEKLIEELAEAAGSRRRRLRTARDRPAPAERGILLRGAGEGGPPQGQDPGKDVRSTSASTSAWSRSRPARSSPSSRSSWRPACG